MRRATTLLAGVTHLPDKDTTARVTDSFSCKIVLTHGCTVSTC